MKNGNIGFHPKTFAYRPFFVMLVEAPLDLTFRQEKKNENLRVTINFAV